MFCTEQLGLETIARETSTENPDYKFTFLYFHLQSTVHVIHLTYYSTLNNYNKTQSYHYINISLSCINIFLSCYVLIEDIN